MNKLIVGDVHANWLVLNTLIEKKKPDVVISIGDFGYWPNFPYTWTKKCVKNGDIPVYFCDGNHDNHWALRDLKSNEIAPNIFYMKRGSTLVLDGKRHLFMGGALSLDKAWRTHGSDWFPEETLSEGDLYGLTNEPIDVIISHTIPDEFELKLKTLDVIDPSRAILSYILNKYKPNEWYAGHFHHYQRGKYRNTRWTVLDKSSSDHWWVVKNK